MRSLLVALDDTPASASAAKFALSLATRHKAAVTGVSILDVSYLTAPEPGAIGTGYYKFKANAARLKRGHEQTERLLGEFRQQCEALGVKGDVLALEGTPWIELREAMAAHDLLLIGCDSDLHGESDGSLARTVEKTLRENPRPIVITPANLQERSRIIIAYDGSVPAARTLQVFTLLGLASGSEIRVVSVDRAQDIADRHVREASAYLGRYDIATVGRPIASEASPAELIMSEVEAVGADFLVMGAYGHRGWREALLGSFTTRLLADCPTAIFVHH